MQISDIFLMSFTCVEEARHVLCHAAILLSSQNRWHEFLNAWCILFFINHVKACDKVWVLFLGNSDVVKYFTDMRVSNNLVARQNQTHLEVRYLLLCLVNDFLDYCNFIQKWHRLLFFVEETSSGVSQLNYENVLRKTSINVGLEENLEERFVFSKTANSCEFMLEILPNFVAFKTSTFF